MMMISFLLPFFGATAVALALDMESPSGARPMGAHEGNYRKRGPAAMAGKAG